MKKGFFEEWRARSGPQGGGDMSDGGHFSPGVVFLWEFVLLQIGKAAHAKCESAGTQLLP